MSNLYDYAKAELERWAHPDSMDQRMVENVLELIKTFSEQGHSGFSAPICIYLFQRLASFLPLSDLTGEEDEWGEPDSRGVRQNKRCFSVFKNKDGDAYDIEGRVFSDDGGETRFTSKDSWVPVTFPYKVPEYPEMVFVEKKGDEK